MIGSDSTLLQQYVKERSETAFNELVQRHLPLVHSAALRQVRSPELADEVAQSVFLDLAKSAPGLKPDTILPAWLYQVTRRTAIDCIRKESRRQVREQAALEMAEMNSDSTEWIQIEPLLDEGMEMLEEQDRTAILLRYFENRSLREVGDLLGVSDDAAQKRVSRAVERLRVYLSRKGLAVSASSLCLLLSANSVQAVPVGLAVKILGTVAAGTVVTAVAKGVSMTALQKSVATLAIAAAVGTGIYQAQQRSDALHELQTQIEQNRMLQEESENFVHELAELRRENERLGKDLMELHKLRGEVGSLKRELSAAKKAGVAQPNIEPDQPPENPPVERFSATIRAAVEWNHALLTGGWTNAAGNRLILFTVPKNDFQNDQVTIQTQIAELPQDSVRQLGLDGFLTSRNEMGVSTGIMGPNVYAAVLKAMHETTGVKLLSSPVVSTSSGQSAQISIVDTRKTGSGQEYSTGPVIDLFPQISPDGESVVLDVSAVLNLPIEGK